MPFDAYAAGAQVFPDEDEYPTTQVGADAGATMPVAPAPPPKAPEKPFPWKLLLGSAAVIGVGLGAYSLVKGAPKTAMDAADRFLK